MIYSFEEYKKNIKIANEKEYIKRSTGCVNRQQRLHLKKLFERMDKSLNDDSFVKKMYREYLRMEGVGEA